MVLVKHELLFHRLPNLINDKNGKMNEMAGLCVEVDSRYD